MTIWTFVGRVMSLVFSTLSRFAMVAQTVKSLPAKWKIWVQSLGQEDPLEKERATHSSVFWPRKSRGQRSLAGYNPWSGKRIMT